MKTKYDFDCGFISFPIENWCNIYTPEFIYAMAHPYFADWGNNPQKDFALEVSNSFRKTMPQPDREELILLCKELYQLENADNEEDTL